MQYLQTISLDNKIDINSSKKLRVCFIGTIDIANIDTLFFPAIDSKEFLDMKNNYKLSYLGDDGLGTGIYMMEFLSDFIIVENSFTIKTSTSTLFTTLYSFNGQIFD